MSREAEFLGHLLTKCHELQRMRACKSVPFTWEEVEVLAVALAEASTRLEESQYLRERVQAYLPPMSPTVDQECLDVLHELLQLHDNEVFVAAPWDRNFERARAVIAKARK